LKIYYLGALIKCERAGNVDIFTRLAWRNAKINFKNPKTINYARQCDFS